MTPSHRAQDQLGALYMSGSAKSAGFGYPKQAIAESTDPYPRDVLVVSSGDVKVCGVEFSYEAGYSRELVRCAGELASAVVC